MELAYQKFPEISDIVIRKIWFSIGCKGCSTYMGVVSSVLWMGIAEKLLGNGTGFFGGYSN